MNLKRSTQSRVQLSNNCLKYTLFGSWNIQRREKKEDTANGLWKLQCNNSNTMCVVFQMIQFVYPCVCVCVVPYQKRHAKRTGWRRCYPICNRPSIVKNEMKDFSVHFMQLATIHSEYYLLRVWKWDFGPLRSKVTCGLGLSIGDHSNCGTTLGICITCEKSLIVGNCLSKHIRDLKSNEW